MENSFKPIHDSGADHAQESVPVANHEAAVQSIIARENATLAARRKMDYRELEAQFQKQRQFLFEQQLRAR